MQIDFFRFSNIDSEFLIRSAIIAVKIIIILLIVCFLQKVIKQLIGTILKKTKTPLTLVELLRSFLRLLVYIIAAVIILQQVGVQISSLWTIITAAATLIAIGFVAVWSVLSNLLCTLMLIISRPFQIGDQIEIIDPAMTAGINGRVRNINLLFTALIEINEDKKEVWRTHIPNNLFFQKIVKCRTGKKTFSLEEQLFKKESLLKRNVQSESE